MFLSSRDGGPHPGGAAAPAARQRRAAVAPPPRGSGDVRGALRVPRIDAARRDRPGGSLAFGSRLETDHVRRRVGPGPGRRGGEVLHLRLPRELPRGRRRRRAGQTGHRPEPLGAPRRRPAPRRRRRRLLAHLRDGHGRARNERARRRRRRRRAERARVDERPGLPLRVLVPLRRGEPAALRARGRAPARGRAAPDAGVGRRLVLPRAISRELETQRAPQRPRRRGHGRRHLPALWRAVRARDGLLPRPRRGAAPPGERTARRLLGRRRGRLAEAEPRRAERDGRAPPGRLRRALRRRYVGRRLLQVPDIPRRLLRPRLHVDRVRDGLGQRHRRLLRPAAPVAVGSGAHFFCFLGAQRLCHNRPRSRWIRARWPSSSSPP